MWLRLPEGKSSFRHDDADFKVESPLIIPMESPEWSEKWPELLRSLQWPLLLRRCRDRMPRNFKKLDLIYSIINGLFMGFLRDVMFFFLGLNGIEWDYIILVNSKDPGIHPKREALNISGRWIVKNPKRPGGLGFFDPRVEKIASKIMYPLVI